VEAMTGAAMLLNFRDLREKHELTQQTFGEM